MRAALTRGSQGDVRYEVALEVPGVVHVFEVKPGSIRPGDEVLTLEDGVIGHYFNSGKTNRGGKSGNKPGISYLVIVCQPKLKTAQDVL